MLHHALGLMDQLCISTTSSKRNDTISLLISHNLALCAQKSGDLTECGSCLKNCLKLYKNLIKQSDPLKAIFKHLKYLSKLHMQYCAILSQQNKHSEAFEHAKYGTFYSHRIIEFTHKVALSLSSESLEQKKTLEGNISANDSFINKIGRAHV